MAASKCRSGPETRREVRRVTADLAQYLSSDRYPLHSRLPPERQLCELLQVSRTVLRNGLEELEREGRIWRHVGKGTFVGGRPQSVQSCAEALGADTTLSELLEARTLIEPQAAHLAALRSEPSDLALVKRCGRERDGSQCQPLSRQSAGRVGLDRCATSEARSGRVSCRT